MIVSFTGKALMRETHRAVSIKYIIEDRENKGCIVVLTDGEEREMVTDYDTACMNWNNALMEK